MSEFPRGWLLTMQAGGGALASITVPAVPGVVHVLDSFSAVYTCSAATGTASANNVQITGGPLLALLALPGGAVGSDSGGGSGLDYATAPGAALTVAFAGASPGSFFEFLTIQGHDI